MKPHARLASDLRPTVGPPMGPEPSALVLAALALLRFAWQQRGVRNRTWLRAASNRFTSLMFTLFALQPVAQAQLQPLFKLTAADATQGNLFGHSVSVSGNVALVGAPNAVTSAGDSGAAYVFDLTTGQQLQKLVASDAQADDLFGQVVALEGNTALIPNSIAITARHFGYSFDITTGQQVRTFTPIGNTYDFGHAVALAGNNGLIGSDSYRPEYTGGGTGGVFLLDTSTGQQLSLLRQSDIGYADDFGRVAISASGNFALIGDAHDSDALLLAGAAYVFDLTTRQQLFKLTASDIAAYMEFGSHVAIDGNIAIIGTLKQESYVFDLTTGQQISKLNASGEIALSGEVALIGTLTDRAGAAYLYNITTGQRIARLVDPEAAPGRLFGSSVALRDNIALVGAYGAGAVYAFDITNVPEPSTLVLAALVMTPFTSRRRGVFRSRTMRTPGRPSAAS